MRILHVISDENIGGAGILLCNLLRNFDFARVQSIVALPRGSALTQRLQALDVPFAELEHPVSRLSVSGIEELSRLMRVHRPAIVHANAALSARVAARLCGIPVLHTRHCCFPASGEQHRLLLSLKGLCNRALSDRVIATAEAAVADLRYLGIPEKKISVIINGSMPVREVTEAELNAVRKSVDVREGDFTVGICARLEECKGHDVFLRAAKRLRAEMPMLPFRFLIVGTGSQRAALERMARELGLADVVRFTGFVSDMAPIYRLLRVNVNCSCGTETSCLALSEGMSASLPMVASDYGGNVAMVGDTGAGMLYPTGDDAALAQCIRRIATDRSLEERMRRAALLRYEQKYTAKRMADEVTSLYEQMLKK